VRVGPGAVTFAILGTQFALKMARFSILVPKQLQQMTYAKEKRLQFDE
jgi:hypothetical protein